MICPALLLLIAVQDVRQCCSETGPRWMDPVASATSKVHQAVWRDMQEAAAKFDSSGERRMAAQTELGHAFPNAEVQIVHPTQGMVVTDSDMPMPGGLLLRCRTKNFVLKRDGYIAVMVRRLDDLDNTGTLVIATEPNTMFITSTSGVHYVTVTLTSWDNVPLTWGRNSAAECLKVQKNVTFTIRGNAAENAVQSLPPVPLNQDGTVDSPWMPQPTTANAAYVVVLTSSDFTDLVMAWAQSLRDARSRFRRICLVAEGLVDWEYEKIMGDCCCTVIRTPPIEAPKTSKLAEPRYRWLLTKFQVWNINQLPEIKRLGWQLSKVILMDADILVLQNIDELFWSPAPAATVGAHSLMGYHTQPTISSGLMVIEPSLEVFAQLQDAMMKPNIGSAGFVEQEVLDTVFLRDGKPTYTVLPFVYNFFPELTQRMDFVHPDLKVVKDFENRPQFQGEEEQAFIEDSVTSSVKVVHFWGLYNPVFAVFDDRPRTVQAALVLRDPSMWRWYRQWWRAHQRSMRTMLGEEQYQWLCQICQQRSQQEEEFVPLYGGRGQSPVCYHPPTDFLRN